MGLRAGAVVARAFRGGCTLGGMTGVGGPCSLGAAAMSFGVRGGRGGSDFARGGGWPCVR